MRIALLAFLLGIAAPLGAEPKLPDLDLSYDVEWKGMGLGTARITLKPDGGADCYRYESLTRPIGLVRMFYGSPHESSEFCVSGNRVVPKRFTFSNPKREDDSFTLEFDAAAGKVRDSRGQVRNIPVDAQDRFGLQQAVRLWVLSHLDKRDETVEFSMVDDRRIRAYRFALTGSEQVDTPAGKFDTIVVQRVDDPNKTIKFWLASERAYMPVQVEQIRKGSTELRMSLRK